jgi:hypothetical protein
MLKEIVVLAKSEKYNNYCIAGMDLSNNNWIRLVSDNVSIKRAVPRSDIICDDGREIELLDIVKVCVKSYQPELHQIENWLYDSEFIWSRSGKMSIDDVYSNLVQKDDKYIFFNSDRRLPSYYINNINYENKYSLKLAKIEYLKIYHEKHEKDKFYVEFKFNGVEYNRISITDLEFKRQFNKYSTLILKNVYVVFSLGEEYKDGYHYKLIASIIPTEDFENYYGR